MKIQLTRVFVKDFKKLDLKIKKAFIKRKKIFLENAFNSILKNHSLNGKYSNFRSINITGDYRAIYYFDKNTKTYFFTKIGTHSELY
ncbi:MAG: type II toxin-antitoxin system mRNA interferase toxin, RelE/StbE family [Candidatus Pacebacteria bacterium]|nr:type II toxin-antitoxin system mRNA interferase toxin, RelE/StbE family [Candidatus Paceibacterota bacterium]